MASSPSLDYWLVYTDKNGISRQRREQLTGFEEESMGGNSGSQWNNKLMKDGCQIIFSELPADFDGDWHENPHPQWIIPLTGGWWVETMDGQRVEMKTGEVSFGADQGTKNEKGHRSGVLNNAPCRMMIIQFPDNEKLRGGQVLPGDA